MHKRNRKKAFSLLAVVLISLSTCIPLRAQTYPEPVDTLWKIRMRTWHRWAAISEAEFLKEYLQTEDTWLRLHVPAMLPLIPEEGNVRFTSGYGWRKHPIGGKTKFHNGIDLAATKGQPVYATAQGVVEKVAYEKGLGTYLVLSHAGLFQTYYGHLSGVLVKVGQLVMREECIGMVGKSGTATGYHLHYIVKRLGKPVDADGYLFLRYGMLVARKSRH